MKVLKTVKLLLRLLILFLIIIAFTIKSKKNKIIEYKSEFSNAFTKMCQENTIKTYKSLDNVKDEIFNGKITILNTYSINDINYLYNLKLVDHIKHKLDSSNLNIVDIFLNTDTETNDNSLIDLIEDKNDIFINKHNINRPVLSLSADVFKQYFNLDDITNKVLVLDELGNLKFVENNDINIDEFIQKIIDISKNNKKIHKNTETLNNDTNSTIDDINFIGKFNKFILIENFNGYDFPIFVIIDDINNNIFITRISGDILYSITDKNFCKISSIKRYKGDLYVSDMCNYSIGKINFKDQKIDIIFKDKQLFGISDFEFLDNNNILISKQLNNGIGIFNTKENSYTSLNETLKTDNFIGSVNRIVHKNGKYYYFDVDNNILYCYDKKNNRTTKIIDLNADKNIMIFDTINNFYVDSKDNIYFMDTQNHRILHYSYGNIYEKYFKNTLYFPNDLIIYKNIHYVLSNNNIQFINTYGGKNRNIELYYSNNRQTFFNLEDIIDLDKLHYKKFTLNSDTINTSNIVNEINIIPYSPSFIMIFEKNKNKVTPVKVFYYNSIINNDGFTIDKNKDYLIYGRLYYNSNTDNCIKIKNVNILIPKEN
ncbi:MAG: hypothetical protein IJ853_03260 [Rickettsiales bacterium]|nr:hypothetical protein [Rickettsiales bacterium]